MRPDREPTDAAKIRRRIERGLLAIVLLVLLALIVAQLSGAPAPS